MSSRYKIPSKTKLPINRNPISNLSRVTHSKSNRLPWKGAKNGMPIVRRARVVPREVNLLPPYTVEQQKTLGCHCTCRMVFLLYSPLFAVASVSRSRIFLRLAWTIIKKMKSNNVYFVS